MYVRLVQDWIDLAGNPHRAGDAVDVDNVTLAELEAGGYVSTDEQTSTRADRETGAQIPSPRWNGHTDRPAPTDDPSSDNGSGTNGSKHPDWPGHTGEPADQEPAAEKSA